MTDRAEQPEREVALAYLREIRDRLGSRVQKHEQDREDRRAWLCGQVDDLRRPEPEASGLEEFLA